MKISRRGWNALWIGLTIQTRHWKILISGTICWKANGCTTTRTFVNCSKSANEHCNATEAVGSFLSIRFTTKRMERKLPTASVALQCSFADFEQLTNVLVVVQPFAFQHIVPLIKIFQCLVCMVKPIHNAFHPRLEIFIVYIHNHAINPMTK